MRLPAVLRSGLIATAVVALATLAGLAVGADALTEGFVDLVLVLGLAVWQGFLAGAIASVLATACLNFFFFPPLHSFGLSEPENWISLGCFLLATTIASRLVVRARERAGGARAGAASGRARADEAESRRREIAALYDLSVDLFTAGASPGGLSAAASRALATIGAQGGGLVLFDQPEDALAARSSPSLSGGVRDPGPHASRSAPGTPGESPDAGSRSEAEAEGPSSIEMSDDLRLPITVGERTVGVLLVRGTRANRAAIASVARLLALALERERFLAEQARLDALQAGDALKTALLRAVSHDLSTPLTAILLSLETLKRETAGDASGSRTVALIVEETTRLNRRVHNLLAMARLEAESVSPRREPTPPADLFHAARENLRPIASVRGLTARVAPECPDLDVDPSLALEILVNLIENADRASPPRAPIELRAAPDPARPERIRIEVLDRGSGLGNGSWGPGLARAGGDRSARERLSGPATDGRRGPRASGSQDGDLGLPGTGAGVGPDAGLSAGDVGRRGLGLEIARSFAAAHGGGVALIAREGGGVAARIDLPAVRDAGPREPEEGPAGQTVERP